MNEQELNAVLEVEKEVDAVIYLDPITGPRGYDGLSAYEIAVKNGFEGTEQEWLDSLHGGAKGDKGDPFTYDDFTEEQLAGLKGPKGDTFTYDDLTIEQIESLRGPKGEPFVYDDFTEEQLANLKGVGIESIDLTATEDLIDTYTITFTDGTTTTFNVVNGTVGADGVDGVDGEDGEDGKTPVRGEDYFTDEDIRIMTNTVMAEVEEEIGIILDRVNGEIIPKEKT